MTQAATNIPPVEAGAKERLLSSALTLFNEKGYAATSVRELVADAGVTKPVLYYYFGNKEGIFLELMENSYRTFEALIVERSAQEGSARERIVRFCADLFQLVRDRLPEVRLIYAIYYGPPQGAPPYDLDTYFARLIEVVLALVAEGIASGEFKQNSVEDAARAVVGLLTSSINEQLCQGDCAIDRDGLIRILNLLMSGIAH